MNVARLDAIYGTLLAHCLRLNEAMAAATRKRFGEVEGKEVPALVDAAEIAETKSAAIDKYIELRIDNYLPCGCRHDGGKIDPASFISGSVEVGPALNGTVPCYYCWPAGFDSPDTSDCRCNRARAWFCTAHRIPHCYYCRFDVFTPELDAVSDDLITFVADELCRLAEYYPPRRVSICSVPSEYGMLLGAAYLARHFDLQGVPGFYMETAPSTPLPGASDETQMIGWLKNALDCPWRINFPKQMMQQQRTTLRTEGENENVNVREAAYAVPSPAVLVPYDSGTGFIVGLKIYPTLRSKPFLLSSRGLPGGAAAVACRG